MDAEALTFARRVVLPETEAQAAVRSRAEQALTPPSPEVGALLRLLAGVGGVRHAVEVGSAGGVSGGWLLAGMGPRGVLTSLEGDSHRYSIATAAYGELGVGDRVRAILGSADEVLGRLSDGQYDLVLAQEPPNGAVLDEIRRLLRPGGVMVVRDVLSGLPAAAALLEAVADAEDLAATVLPLDGGVLVAHRDGDIAP